MKSSLSALFLGFCFIASLLHAQQAAPIPQANSTIAPGGPPVSPANPPSSPAPDHGPTVYRPGNGVSEPRLIHSVSPVYPSAARKTGTDGVAFISIIVGPDGKAHNVRVARPGVPDFDEAALDAVKQYEFEPGMKDGKPVPVILTVQVTFHICTYRADCKK